MIKFLLDEDIPPKAAEIARGLGLDAHSVIDLGRTGWSDAQQLSQAAEDQRVFVTYNRDDFIQLTKWAFQGGDAHTGVVIVPRSIPRKQPARLAHALARWSKALERRGDAPLTAYLCVFLSAKAYPPSP